MYRGITLVAAVIGLLGTVALQGANAAADVYKVVDEQGNVTYTDQAPADGSAPMKLPELSIVDTDYVKAATTTEVEDSAESSAELVEPTPRELRKMYQDFHITQPLPEETFWGTANTVVIAWGSSKPILPNMSVRLFIDGQRQANSQDNMFAVTLDRGEHQAYAELLDPRGRRVVASPIVTFFVKQNTVGFNRPAASPKISN